MTVSCELDELSLSHKLIVQLILSWFGVVCSSVYYDDEITLRYSAQK